MTFPNPHLSHRIRSYCLIVSMTAVGYLADLATPTAHGQQFGGSSSVTSPAPTAQLGGEIPSARRRSAAADPAAGGRFTGKVQRYAARLMSKYDLNGDRLLDQSEWIAMRGDPAGTMDLDGDGVITTDEIVTRVGVYGRRSLRVVPNVPVRTAESNDEADDNDAGARMAYRVVPDGEQRDETGEASGSPGLRMMRRFFVTPSQLPQGVAGWFLDNDADGDGQVTMAEFSANWTEVEASRFASYDLNSDGVITAEECAQAESERLESEAAADESTAAPDSSG